VIIAVLDAGFSNLSHEVFAPMTILARRDFVNGDEDVGDGADQGEGSHGTMTLSVLGGFKEGQLIGPAYAAGFILAKTENTASETPVEEDNWAAAAEWAEALGADVISTSLGYLDYDSPFTSYSFADMNGETAISTRAANLAASLGVVVVASAGNSGFDAAHNTLGAPADGRGVIAAGAVDARGTRAFFSSVGPTADGRIKPDVDAQGVSVKVASPTSPSLYGLADGTSFSCPLTAGVAALVVQAHPEYTPQQVADALRSTASQAGRPDNLLGYGIVNAAAAVGSRASASQPGQWVPWDRHP
jgi:subtilisin family serine protease